MVGHTHISSSKFDGISNLVNFSTRLWEGGKDSDVGEYPTAGAVSSPVKCVSMCAVEICQEQWRISTHILSSKLDGISNSVFFFARLRERGEDSEVEEHATACADPPACFAFFVAGALMDTTEDLENILTMTKNLRTRTPWILMMCCPENKNAKV